MQALELSLCIDHKGFTAASLSKETDFDDERQSSCRTGEKARSQGPGWTGMLMPLPVLMRFCCIGHSTPATLFFQSTKEDVFVSKDEAYKYFNAASELKSIEWYDSGHGMNVQARRDRIDWWSGQNLTPKNWT